MPSALVPLGDCAVYVEFASNLDLEVNSLVLRLAKAVQTRGLPWIRDVVPALGGLALHFDPDHEALGGDAMKACVELVDECMKAGPPGEDEVARTVEVPVCYEPQYAPDLAEVAKLTKLTAEEVIACHVASEHRVLMVGFAPGHAYIGGLDPKVAVPRRATPRSVVPAGSVAIANDQTVVYPYAISGGWSIIGCTPLKVFDVARPEPSLFAAGDKVKFRAISRAEFQQLAK